MEASSLSGAAIFMARDNRVHIVFSLGWVRRLMGVPSFPILKPDGATYCPDGTGEGSESMRSIGESRINYTAPIDLRAWPAPEATGVQAHVLTRVNQHVGRTREAVRRLGASGGLFAALRAAGAPVRPTQNNLLHRAVVIERR